MELREKKQKRCGVGERTEAGDLWDHTAIAADSKRTWCVRQGLPHPGRSQRAFLTARVHLYNLIPKLERINADQPTHTHEAL